MNSVVIAKFGGSTIGVDGISIPVIIQRINSLSNNTIRSSNIFTINFKNWKEYHATQCQ